jgi:hypothetical protein
MGRNAKRRREDQPVIHPPGPYAEFREAASDRDREYFRTHPGETWYLRERMPYEFPPMLVPERQDVLVRWFSPTIRFRQTVSADQAVELEAAKLAGISVFFEENEITSGLMEMAAHGL